MRNVRIDELARSLRRFKVSFLGGLEMHFYSRICVKMKIIFGNFKMRPFILQMEFLDCVFFSFGSDSPLLPIPPQLHFGTCSFFSFTTFGPFWRRVWVPPSLFSQLFHKWIVLKSSDSINRCVCQVTSEFLRFYLFFSFPFPLFIFNLLQRFVCNRLACPFGNRLFVFRCWDSIFEL